MRRTGRTRVRVQGFEFPVGASIGLVRWFPRGGEWQHEMVAGSVRGLDEDGRIELVIGDELRTFDNDTWTVCSATAEPLEGIAS